MRSIFLLFISASFLFSQAAPPTPATPVHFKELQKCLPKKGPAGFTAGKPKGQTMSSTGFTTSTASVEFTAPKKEKQWQTLEDGKQDSVDVDVTWTVKTEIMDYAGLGEGMSAALTMVTDMQFENETEDGSEKSTTVNGMKGIEKTHTAEGSHSCSFRLVYGGRFLITMDGDGFSDTGILKAFIDAMELKALPAAK